jgi:purine-nucleoside/S-methyl-5'-thioadenosine phosphorylase / adenosine deaminase
MPFQESDTIRYFTFESFSDAGVVHGVITRRGGKSPNPWASLNVGGTVGDDAERVRQNRSLSFRALGRPFESLYDVWQVHGTEVVCTGSPRQVGQPHRKADAILTDQPGVTLFMRFADCVPIFLYDPRRKVVGLVHAGWKGTVDRTLHFALQAMRETYHSRLSEILAGIGPAIGAHHYQVGVEVVEQVKAAFGSDAEALLESPNGSSIKSGVKFDLWGANRLILEEAGVRKIEMSGICTACHLEDWYSHRGENGRTGRFGALIGL